MVVGVAPPAALLAAAHTGGRGVAARLGGSCPRAHGNRELSHVQTEAHLGCSGQGLVLAPLLRSRVHVWQDPACCASRVPRANAPGNRACEDAAITRPCRRSAGCAWRDAGGAPGGSLAASGAPEARTRRRGADEVWMRGRRAPSWRRRAAGDDPCPSMQPPGVGVGQANRGGGAAGVEATVVYARTPGAAVEPGCRATCGLVSLPIGTLPNTVQLSNPKWLCMGAAAPWEGAGQERPDSFSWSRCHRWRPGPTLHARSALPKPMPTTGSA